LRGRLKACLAFILLLSSSLSYAAAAPGPEDGAGAEVSLAIFSSRTCTHCGAVERGALEALARRTGVSLDLHCYDIDEAENYELLLRVEAALGDPDNEFPVVVAGRRILGGEEEVEEQLEEEVRRLAAGGGCALPDVLTGGGAAAEKAPAEGAGRRLYVAFFTEAGCTECARLVRALEYLHKRSGALEYRVFDAGSRKGARLLEALSERAGIPEQERGVLPAAFVGMERLAGGELTEAALRKKIKTKHGRNSSVPWELEGEDLEKAGERIAERFASLGPLAVIAAGLADGVNPCAFATIVFFVSYLVTTGRGRREIIAVGLAFSGAVFATYLLVGLGAFRALTQLKAYAFVAQAVDAAAGGLALCFAAVSLNDYFKARKGQADRMRLVLPSFLKKRINLNISRQLRTRGLVLGALTAGALVSLFELACTGQVYVPTLVLISGSPGLRSRALAYLVLYNLMFVLPLLVILAVVARGLSSEGVSAFFGRHLPAGKLALAVTFFLLACFVFGNLALG